MQSIDIENNLVMNTNNEVDYIPKKGDESSTAINSESGENNDPNSPASDMTVAERAYKLYKKILYFDYSLHLLVFFIFFVLYVAAVYDIGIEKIEDTLGTKGETFYWSVLKIVAMHFGIHFTIKLISSFLRMGTAPVNAFFFYVSEINMYISTALILFWLIANTDDGKLNISTYHKLTIKYCEVYKILMEATVFFGFQKVISRRISLSFNYGLHLERIRECLIREYFLSTITAVARNNAIILPNIDNGVPWLSGKKSAYSRWREINNALFSDITRVEKDNACKRVLLDEFKRRCNTFTGFHDDPFLNAAKFRKYAMRKATKLSAKLLNLKFTSFGLLGNFFENEAILNLYLEKLKLKPDSFIIPTILEHIIIKYGEEKYYLHMSLRQMNLALDRVNFFISVLASIIFIGIMFSYIIPIENPVLAFFGTIFGTSFVLNSSIENAVSCAIFLFFIHPYDVGDRIFVNLDNREENLVVAELNVFSTVFLRWDGVVLVVPNQILREKPIINIRRCGVMTEFHRIQIDVNTPPEKIDSLKGYLKRYVMKNSEVYTDYLIVNFESIENNNILHLRVVMQYRKNWQNYDRYLEIRSEFLKALNSSLQKCGIDYQPLTQKIKICDGKY